MIELRQVSKVYGPAPGRGRAVVALEETSLGIPAGTTWAVVGPNGAGKTTLFALTLGFLGPTTGQVRIDGLAPRAFTRRHGAAYLPERFQLPGEWSITAALHALARLERHRGPDAKRRADQAIERFGLAPHAHKPLATLSRGLLQRVGLAQTLLGESPLVVLDEPTEGLDPLWRVQFRDLIAELHRDGRTTLIASHDLAEVERIAEQAVLLEAGRVREIIPIDRATPGTTRYRIELARPAPVFAEIFPGATPELQLDDDATASDDTSAAYLVEVADHQELSARLAALLATGATLVAAGPAAEPLEERVRQALASGEVDK
jgi:ABC-type multidrug transport system ATPase subunit